MCMFDTRVGDFVGWAVAGPVLLSLRACGVAERIESWDVTSLYVYPTCLMGDLPVPNATWLTSSEIAALDPETFLFDEEGERHFWVVTCDMEANPTCFYPIVSMKRDVGGTQKLVFDNSNLRGECTCGASPPCFIPHGPSCAHNHRTTFPT